MRLTVAPHCHTQTQRYHGYILIKLKNTSASMLSYWVIATRFHVDLSLHGNIFHFFKCPSTPSDHQHPLLWTEEGHFWKCVNAFLFVSPIFHTLLRNISYTRHRKAPDSPFDLYVNKHYLRISYLRVWNSFIQFYVSSPSSSVTAAPPDVYSNLFPWNITNWMHK